tara:strand:- start:105 stop:1637 length:1533 start_codon:yes stop_codon:yes gene_type:complete
MNMRIFQDEMNAGLEDQIRSNASIAYTSLATPNSITQLDSEERDAKIKEIIALSESIAASNPDQIDLYYLNSVLVSTGWNKNDDVFDTRETWIARSTPEDKQFNFMHNEEDIIGHITGNCVVSSDGSVIADDTLRENIPEKFDIITSAVIYKSWSDMDKRERIHQIIAEIEEGKWFVSMECLFNGFDYAVVSPDGNHNTILRDESSAFLTKHLRAYGGEGNYEGHKIGRLLRNISFSGKGLVNNPANPNSIILKGLDPFKSTQACIIEESSIREISHMSNDAVLQQQLDALKAELDASKQREETLEAKLKEVDEKAITEKIEAMDTQLQAKNDEIAEMLEAQEAIVAEKTELTESLEKLNEEFAAIQAELENIKAEAHKAARLAALVQAGLDEEAATEKLEKFAGADDELFAEIVALITVTSEETVEEETEAEVDAEVDVEAEEVAEADEDIASDEAADEADAETLEEAEEEVEASLTDAGETEEVEEARTSASDWLRKNILKSTASIEK